MSHSPEFFLRRFFENRFPYNLKLTVAPVNRNALSVALEYDLLFAMGLTLANVTSSQFVDALVFTSSWQAAGAIRRGAITSR
jgi:hypothetical protein